MSMSYILRTPTFCGPPAQFSSLYFTLKTLVYGTPPLPLRFTKEGRWAPLVAVAVCLPMTGIPFGTAFPKTIGSPPPPRKGHRQSAGADGRRLLC